MVQSPTFKTLLSGEYNLIYRVTDIHGCSAAGNLKVIVDSPDATFDITPSAECSPGEISFTKADWTGIDSWTWDFGDGSANNTTEKEPTHTYTNTTSTGIEYYTARLTVISTGGCEARYTRTVTIYPAIDATITADKQIVCSGEYVTLSALPGAMTYDWDYGDGGFGSGTYTMQHLFTNETSDGSPVVRTVTLTTTSVHQCTDVKTIEITVLPAPLPQFEADLWSQIFISAGNPVQFTNGTNPGEWTWQWNFGDNTATSTEEDPEHIYTSTGTFVVTLTASNAYCSAEVSHNVMVIPPAPVANFYPVPSGCAPLYVQIINTSLNTDVPGTTYHWDFGDGSTSTMKNPTYTYFTPGNYRIELTVTGPGGSDSYPQMVEAYPSPKAYFEITPPMVYVNDERVRCFNLSQGATSYMWNFGDGDTSRMKEPYHRYMEEGEYDITLWAYSENGCTDVFTLSPAVTVEPVGELRFSTVFMPNKTGPIERTDLPTGGYDADQFFYPPIRQKVMNYKLQVFNRLGVLIFQSNDINVPWNGYYKGDLCQQGVYVWYVEGKYANGKPFKMVGNVTLLH
jgi:PKD repeat protein